LMARIVSTNDCPCRRTPVYAVRVELADVPAL